MVVIAALFIRKDLKMSKGEIAVKAAQLGSIMTFKRAVHLGNWNISDRHTMVYQVKDLEEFDLVIEKIARHGLRFQYWTINDLGKSEFLQTDKVGLIVGPYKIEHPINEYFKNNHKLL